MCKARLNRLISDLSFYVPLPIKGLWRAGAADGRTCCIAAELGLADRDPPAARRYWPDVGRRTN